MPVAQTRLEILQIHKFLQCVRSKDKAQIEKLCSNGVPHLVNYSEPEEGETALHLAARVNDEEMVRFLLDLGAHPNVIDLKGRTAAMRAAEFGHVQTLEILATAGSDMKVKDTDGKGILFYCILPTSRHARCTTISIENGAECNNVSNAGMPLLVVACTEAKENEDICKKLLDHGADPNSMNPSTGQTALSAAAGSGSVDVVKAILSKGGEVNTPDKNMLTPTHRAAMRGHFEVLQVLSSYGADFSVVDVILNTPAHYAAEGGHALCLRYLAQRGAKAHIKNEDGLLPKVIAKNYGFKDALKEAKKAEKLAKKIHQTGGKLPTEPWAVRLYDWSVARQEDLSKKFSEMDPEFNEVISKDQFFDVLMNLDAPITEADFKALFTLHDKTKENVLNYSDFLGGKKYVHKTYLMSAYAKKDKKKKGKKGKKKKGKTKVPMPICLGPEGDRTERGGPPPVFIERHVPFTDTGRFDRDRPPLHPIQDDSAWYLSHPDKTYINVNDAAKMGDIESLKQAYIHGRTVDVRDKYFKTALMISCGQGNLAITKFLVDNGAQINTVDNFKWTPLHHACLAGQLDIVQLLVDSGADMNAQALNGGTPLMRAIQTGSPDVVQYLINKGCNVTLENRKGDTAMDVARWWADPRVLQIVSDKFETIAPPKEGKKKGKKSAGKKGDGAKRAQSVPPIPQGGLTSQPSGTDSPTTTPRERKGSVLRAASAMAGGIEHQEDITYIPLMSWSHVPNTRQLIIKKEQRRQRYGDGIDFPDYYQPFKENFMNKSKELGGVDSDDD